MARKKRKSLRDFTAAELSQSIQYAEDLRRPESWIRTADDLLEAAKLLEAQLERFWAAEASKGEAPPLEVLKLASHLGPYYLLMGHVLENLCKAELVRMNEESLRNRIIRDLPDYLDDHDLRRLVGRIGLSLDLQEEELLARLTHAAIWSGRYPVPKRPDALRHTTILSDGQARFTSFRAPDDIRRVHALVARLRDRLGISIPMPT